MHLLMRSMAGRCEFGHKITSGHNTLKSVCQGRKYEKLATTTLLTNFWAYAGASLLIWLADPNRDVNIGGATNREQI